MADTFVGTLKWVASGVGVTGGLTATGYLIESSRLDLLGVHVEPANAVAAYLQTTAWMFITLMRVAFTSRGAFILGGLAVLAVVAGVDYLAHRFRQLWWLPTLMMGTLCIGVAVDMMRLDLPALGVVDLLLQTPRADEVRTPRANRFRDLIVCTHLTKVQRAGLANCRQFALTGAETESDSVLLANAFLLVAAIGAGICIWRRIDTAAARPVRWSPRLFHALTLSWVALSAANLVCFPIFFGRFHGSTLFPIVELEVVPPNETNPIPDIDKAAPGRVVKDDAATVRTAEASTPPAVASPTSAAKDESPRDKRARFMEQVALQQFWIGRDGEFLVLFVPEVEQVRYVAASDVRVINVQRQDDLLADLYRRRMEKEAKGHG